MIGNGALSCLRYKRVRNKLKGSHDHIHQSSLLADQFLGTIQNVVSWIGDMTSKIDVDLPPDQVSLAPIRSSPRSVSLPLTPPNSSHHPFSTQPTKPFLPQSPNPSVPSHEFFPALHILTLPPSLPPSFPRCLISISY
jgi:hypothetical protein